MNLSINNAIQNQTSFQARIKMGKPNLKTIAQTAIGTSAVATGSALVAGGAMSMEALGDAGSITNALPVDKEIANGLHDGLQESLYSADTKYDAAGEIKGIPVQSTIVPSGLVSAGAMSSNAGSNAFVNAYGKENLKAIAKMPIDASRALSANKMFQKSALGTSYLGTAAASIYSGLHPDILPQSVMGMPGSPEDYADENGYVDPYFYDQSYQGDSANSLLISGFAPILSGSAYGLSKASDTKSSQFVKETLSENKSNTNIPS